MNNLVISVLSAALVVGFAQGAAADVSVSTETKTSTSTGVDTDLVPSVTKKTTSETRSGGGVIEHETTDETHTSDGLTEKHEVTKKTTQYD